MKNTILHMIHHSTQYAIWFIIKMLYHTYRFEVRGEHFREEAKNIGIKGPYIFALWHEHAFSVMCAHAWTEQYLALASRSKDGDYAAFISEKMGFISVRGSSKKRNVDKGGKAAIQEYISKIQQGYSGGLTVDGPKGPRQKCKLGVVIMASQSGAPILPVVALATKYWEFNSWDKFKIPKPFAHIILQYGPPLLIPEKLDSIESDKSCEVVTLALKKLESEMGQNEVRPINNLKIS